MKRISIPLLLFLLASPGCAPFMGAYREQTSPYPEMPIPCEFACPVSLYAGPWVGAYRLDTLLVSDLRENTGSIGSMYSGRGPFTLVCMDDVSFERMLEEDLASLLDRHSIAVGGDPAGRFPTGVSLYVEILDAWVESGPMDSTDSTKVPIEASVVFRAALQDDRRGTVLWEEEFRGNDRRNARYSFSPYHAESLEKSYCETIRSFETAIGSAGFLRAIRR